MPHISSRHGESPLKKTMIIIKGCHFELPLLSMMYMIFVHMYVSFFVLRQDHPSLLKSNNAPRTSVVTIPFTKHFWDSKPPGHIIPPAHNWLSLEGSMMVYVSQTSTTVVAQETGFKQPYLNYLQPTSDLALIWLCGHD